MWLTNGAAALVLVIDDIIWRLADFCWSFHLDTHWNTVRLVGDLEELLYHFPLASVISQQAHLAEQAHEALFEYLGQIGSPGRRFWDTAAELMYDEVGTHLGAMFVLLQVGITETVSIVNNIYKLHGEKIRKSSILSLEAATTVSGASYQEIANAAANYYKHRHEWPQNWANATSQSKKTVELISRIGMSESKDLADNLYCAVGAITDRANAKALPALVVEGWRMKLASKLRSDFLTALT